MKTKVLLYCTKAKPYLGNKDTFGKYHLEDQYHFVDKYSALNGKIVAECEVECEKIWFESTPLETMYFTNKEPDIRKKSCLTELQLKDYLGIKGGYDCHIHNLKPFDRPLELSELKRKCVLGYGKEYSTSITKAPQNMQWVYLNGIRYCLISVRSKWLCKIMNGEKTDEIRRKILKGM